MEGGGSKEGRRRKKELYNREALLMLGDKDANLPQKFPKER